MLTFSTVFPLSETTNSSEIRALIRKWLIGSQHSAFSEQSDFSDDNKSKWTVHLDNESLRGSILCRDGTEYIATRYENRDSSGVTWTTDITYEGREGENRICVQVQCESSRTALALPPARKPYIVRQLVEEFGGGNDGALVVSDQPIVLTNNDIDFAARIINGKANNILPVIFLSAPTSGNFLIDAQDLSRWLSGMAHVVVEPNREFSFRLMHEVNHNNAYGGAIALYWPDHGKKELLLARDYDFDSKALAREISKLIRDRAIRIRVPRSLTWDYQTEIIAQVELERLKSEGSSNLDEYIDNFDTEIKAKDRAIEEAEGEIRRLQAEIHNLRAQTNQLSGEPVIVRGNEKDLYERETAEIVFDILLKAAREAKENSRRKHVLDSLVSANSSSSNRQDYASRIKDLLSQYRKLDSQTLHELEEMGFEVSSDGKHHKLLFRGDNRYVVSMPKTSSDHRAGKNLVSQIITELF